MRFIKPKVIVGFTAVVLVLGSIGITSSSLLDADAAKSPYDHLPQVKKEQEEKQERLANAAREKNVKKPEGNPGPSKIQEDAPIKTEIIDFVDDPMRNKVIFFTNGWIAPKENGKSVTVYAGSLVEDPEQGVLLVRHYNEQRFMGGSNIIKTPEKIGSITIKDFNGMTLTLKAEDGTELEFNVQSEKFK